MNIEQKIQRLREEAKKNPVASAVFHSFAMRQRARVDINLNTLVSKMQHEGFKFEKGDYIPVIKLLAELGFGTLKTGYNGRVLGLSDIRTTLQSIGKAACGDEAELEGFKPRNKFASLPVVRQAARTEVVVNKEPELVKPLTVSMTIKGKPITLSLPPDLEPQEIAAIIAGVQRNK